ncbi:MAG: hypothetical protein ABH837_02860 [bacterium]
MPEMSIEEAEKRLPTTMRVDQTASRSSAVIDEPCPKCDSRVACFYVGTTTANDYYDEFGHICLNPECDHILHYEDRTGDLGAGRNCPASNKCHFCDRKLEMPS